MDLQEELTQARAFIAYACPEVYYVDPDSAIPAWGITEIDNVPVEIRYSEQEMLVTGL